MSKHISFQNPPLLEMIVELRWAAGDLPQPVPDPNPIGFTRIQVGNTQEDFFERVGVSLAKLGFVRQQRLVPLNSPLLPYQPVYRFQQAEDVSPVLFHVGPGLFAVNAVPPYESWHQFSKLVRVGLNTLLETRPEAERVLPFDTVSVRYIDAFVGPLLAGHDPITFIEEVLGIRLTLPEAIRQHVGSGRLQWPYYRVALPAREARELALMVASATVRDAPAAILDWVCRTTAGQVEPRLETLVDVLDGLHTLIHNAFMECTRDIHHVLGPEVVEDGSDR